MKAVKYNKCTCMIYIMYKLFKYGYITQKDLKETLGLSQFDISNYKKSINKALSEFKFDLGELKYDRVRKRYILK